jgi:hypothetical protein
MSEFLKAGDKPLQLQIIVLILMGRKLTRLFRLKAALNRPPNLISKRYLL